MPIKTWTIKVQARKAKMAKTADKAMSRTITSIGFNNDNTIDEEILKQANVYASQPENEGISPLAVLRNFFLRKLREANSEQVS